MWFDGEWEDAWTHEMGIDLYEYVRSLQPSILINNRVDKGRKGMHGFTKEGDFRGDFGTPEQIRSEVEELRSLHEEYPGMMLYRGGGNPRPGNAEAFEACFQELLVYE